MQQRQQLSLQRSTAILSLTFLFSSSSFVRHFVRPFVLSCFLFFFLSFVRILSFFLSSFFPF